MPNKEIQSARVRQCFIDAAKEILKGEGLKSISARNVSARAGYSYATLYNYFSDIKELIFECVVDFQKECTQEIQNTTQSQAPSSSRLKKIIKSYIQYFIQYPGIFELFFLESAGSSNQKTNDLIINFLDQLLAEDLSIIQKNAKGGQIETVKNSLKYTVTGLLLFYLNRREFLKYSDFIQQVDTQLEFII